MNMPGLRQTGAPCRNRGFAIQLAEGRERMEPCTLKHRAAALKSVQFEFFIGFHQISLKKVRLGWVFKIKIKIFNFLNYTIKLC